MRKIHSTNNTTKSKPVKPTSNKVEPVENPKKVEEVVMIPKQENKRIPEEWKTVDRKERFDPFDNESS